MLEPACFRRWRLGLDTESDGRTLRLPHFEQWLPAYLAPRLLFVLVAGETAWRLAHDRMPWIIGNGVFVVVVLALLRRFAAHRERSFSHAALRVAGRLRLPISAKWLRRFTVMSLCVAIGQLAAAAGPQHAEHLRSAGTAFMTGLLLLAVLRVRTLPDASS
jgi:hypothetical protein